MAKDANKDRHDTAKSKEEQEEQEKQSMWRDQVSSLIENQVARHPFLLQGRAVIRQLRSEREMWPLLLPLVAIVFLRTYREERRKLLQRERDVNIAEASAPPSLRRYGVRK